MIECDPPKSLIDCLRNLRLASRKEHPKQHQSAMSAKFLWRRGGDELGVQDFVKLGAVG